MKYHNKGGGTYKLGEPSPIRYTEFITDRAGNFNVLTSNPLKCVRPNHAVLKLVHAVVESLEGKKDSSKAIKFFDALENIRYRYHLSYGSGVVKRGDVKRFNEKFNLTDIIKEINNEIKVQCDKLVEKDRCYKNMNTKIKESTKEIFYYQISRHIRLTYDNNDGYPISVFDDFDAKNEDKFLDFVEEVSASEGSADVPAGDDDATADNNDDATADNNDDATAAADGDEANGDGDEKGSGDGADGHDHDAEQRGGRRRRRRTASKRRSGKRRSTRKRSSKRRGGKKSVSKAGKRKTMKRKH